MSQQQLPHSDAPHLNPTDHISPDDDRIAFLTKKVSELEHALRDAKMEVRYLRLENRTLADQFADRNPSLYSASIVMDWIEEDMLPMQTYTPSDTIKHDLGSTRRSRPSSNPSLSPAITTRRSTTKGPGGSRNSPAMTQNTQSASFESTSVVARPTSALGRYSTNAGTTPTSSSVSSPMPAKIEPVVKRANIPNDLILDEFGMPKLPVTLGHLTVVALGTICSEDGYCNERNVFPIGYTVQREFMSCTRKDSSTVYSCTILKGARSPTFQITAADQPSAPHTGNSATEVWTQITKEANLIRGRHITSKISGPEYYGLNNLVIISWIQKLPGIYELNKYHVQEIVLTRKGGPVEPRAKSMSPKIEFKDDPPSHSEEDDPMDEG